MAAKLYLAIATGTAGPAVVPPGTLAGPALPAGVGFEVQAFSWGVGNPVQIVPGSGLSAGRASFSDFNVVTQVGAASPSLIVRAASGTASPQVQLVLFTVFGGNLRETERYVLQGAVISAVQHSGAQGEQFAAQSLAFAYRSIKHSLYAYDALNRPSVVAEAGWDLVRNVAF